MTTAAMTTTAMTTTTAAAMTTTAAATAKRQSGRKQDCHYNRHRQSKLRRHESPPFAKEHDIARSAIIPACWRSGRPFRFKSPARSAAADR
jgi:hypothetical protein